MGAILPYCQMEIKMSPQTATFNADKVGNIAKNLSAGLRGFLLILPVPDQIWKNKFPAWQLFATLSLASYYKNHMEKPERKRAQIYDLRLRARVE